MSAAPSAAHASPLTLVAPHWLACIPTLGAAYRAGELPAPVLAARCFLYWQAALHGERLALRRSRRDPRPDVSTCLAAGTDAAGLADTLTRYDFRGVRRRAVVALGAWLRAQWPLTLCATVPDSDAVLRMQAGGTRPVTVVTEDARLRQPLLDKPNAFAFLLHDLEHAWQFFRDPGAHRVQRRFAQRLLAAIEQGRFRRYRDDAMFAAKFDYLAADMNTHVVHSLQYLRAILIEFYLRRERAAPAAELSPRARAELHALWHTLGTDWELDAPARGALEMLHACGRLAAREAAALTAAMQR